MALGGFVSSFLSFFRFQLVSRLSGAVAELVRYRLRFAALGLVVPLSSGIKRVCPCPPCGLLVLVEFFSGETGRILDRGCLAGPVFDRGYVPS
jgi:hypothetical protein